LIKLEFLLMFSLSRSIGGNLGLDYSKNIINGQKVKRVDLASAYPQPSPV